MYNVLLILVTQIHGLEAFQLGKITSSSAVHFPPQLPHTTGLLFIFPQPRTCMLSFPRNAWVFCQHHDERISYFLGDVEKRQIGQ